MSPTTSNSHATRIRSLLVKFSWHPWLLVATGAFMTHISWLKWPDLVIDFGEQAYIAWRLSEGAVLYRDIVYFYGPLSSYVHALLFKLFGTQLIVLIIFNLALVAVLTVGIPTFSIDCWTDFSDCLRFFSIFVDGKPQLYLLLCLRRHPWNFSELSGCGTILDVRQIPEAIKLTTSRIAQRVGPLNQN